MIQFVEGVVCGERDTSCLGSTIAAGVNTLPATNAMQKHATTLLQRWQRVVETSFVSKSADQAGNAEILGDLVSKGIIDPTKVVRTALQDAASIAGLLMTTEAMVAEKPKKETPMPAMPPGGGMDY